MAGQLLVRRPPKSLAAGIVSHIEDNRDSIDYQLALSQWQRYTQVYRDRGWTVKEIEKDDALPDSVFVEDGVVFVGSPDESSPEAIFIIASPGNVAREGEIVAIEADLRSSSKHQVVRIEKPGTLDGGDVLKVPSQRIIYIGQSQRTNDDGIRQFTTHVSSLGWKVRKVPVKKALHLSELRPLASTDEGRRDCVESMITALPDGTVIGYEPLLEDSRLFPSFLPVQEPEGAAVVFLERDSLSAKTLVISSSAPKTAQLLRQRGYEVVQTDVSEFEVSPAQSSRDLEEH